MKNTIERMLVALIAGVAVIWRVVCAIFHFTHYDDAGLIVSILQCGESLWEKLHYNSVIPWTYAPLQCWMTAALIHADYSYAANIFLGRLPSLLFSIVNIFLVYYFFTKVFPDRAQLFERVIAVFLISFSWEMAIYAAQSEPYSVGVTGILMLMLVFYDICSRKKINMPVLIITGTIAGYMQYQLFAFVFCFFISLFIIFIKDRKLLLRSFLCSIICFVCDLPVIKYFLSSGLLERGTNWNVGINRQFCFEWDRYAGFEKIKYVISFFAKNTLIWFRSMFVFKDSTWYANVLTVCLIILAILGFVYTVRKWNKMNLFLISSLMANLLLVFLGKLTFSPSRHTIIFVPIIIYYIVYGLHFLQDKAKRVSSVCIAGVFLSIFALLVVDFYPEWTLRKNKMSEKIVNEWIEEEEPVFIGFYKDTFDLSLMHIPGYVPGVGGIWKENKEIEAGDIIIFYSRAAAIEDEYIGFLDNYLGERKLELVSSIELPGDVEVEYSLHRFNNFGNGFYKYSYRIVERWQG